jgi:hypothetical protein
MIRRIISLYKIWRLKREIRTIEMEIEEFYVGEEFEFIALIIEN